MTESKLSLSAPSLAEGHKLDIHTYPKKRRCKKSDCRRLLSIYNPGPWCNAHATYGIELENSLIEKSKLRSGRIYRRKNRVNRPRSK